MFGVDAFMDVAFLVAELEGDEYLLDYLDYHAHGLQLLLVIKLMKGFSRYVFQDYVQKILLVEILDYLHDIRVIQVFKNFHVLV